MANGRGMVLAGLGAVLALAGCAAVPPPLTPVPICPSASRNWVAFINAMPGPGARPALIVTGEVEVPRGGLVPRLLVGPTDRRFPPGQRFRLTLEPEAGAPSGWREVRGEIRPSLPAYGEVIIGCEAEVVARISPVETAS